MENNVDDRFGNYDYLMFANIDYHHEQAEKKSIRWGHWLADTTGCGGSLDAIKHMITSLSGSLSRSRRARVKRFSSSVNSG